MNSKSRLELAPAGVLRAAINFGNPVLARREADGTPGGITADLARELARTLDARVAFVGYEQAGEVFAGLDTGAWDVCFLAIEPVRAARIAFSAPYITIEGVYLVPDGSPLNHAGDVDSGETRIGVIEGSAYDLFLTRGLRQASLVRMPGPEAVLQALVDKRVDLIAGVKPALEAAAPRAAGSRLLPEPFMSIRQAMGVPREREAAAACVATFVDDARRSGLLAELFARNKVEGGSLA
jgi:polar amino acid transport system substrate-binding protein